MEDTNLNASAALGKKVRELRVERGWSQEKLAAVTGLHRTYIGGIERGERNVSLQNILQIARALDTTPSVLVEEVR